VKNSAVSTPVSQTILFEEQSLQLSVNSKRITAHFRYTFPEITGGDLPAPSVTIPKPRRKSITRTATLDLNFGVYLQLTFLYSNRRVQAVKIATIEQGEIIPYSEQKISSVQSLDGFVLTV